MKILLNCLPCHDVSKLYPIEIQDTAIYEIDCEKGHKTVQILNEAQFETLFELGSLALLDGYTREAVSSYASSLERFYEFCIRVLLSVHKVNYSTMNETWKMVTVQSERQLGAFYFIWLLHYKKTPPKIAQKWVTFRNDVIHKGYIPKYDETKQYATSLYEYMLPIIIEFKRNYTKHFEHLKDKDFLIDKYACLSSPFVRDTYFLSKETMFNLVSSKDPLGNFDEALAMLAKRKDTLYSNSF
ncbi:hypothetical protein E8L90_03190 [Brevibacillus antibioticus]|uniref:Uncharacterized protein n=1 Tax=Brevibacillus antibioticus TaxID=2570228 RepID=A0A4U2Y2A2_9BACL|nr:hypothetical protein [Brevibacillus antibioticus]TKI54526.1 hypothetical protein E8L90_03190 [Brevibacillus antibioticus]